MDIIFGVGGFFTLFFSIIFFAYIKRFCMWIFYITKDLIHYKARPPFGSRLYVATNGNGKTISIVEFAMRMKKKFPKMLIVTNFYFEGQTEQFTSWQQFVDMKNGKDGILFLIDEAQNLLESRNWKNCPPIFGEITQLRKERKCICWSVNGDDFSTIDKSVRDTAMFIIDCSTPLSEIELGRWVFQTWYKRKQYKDGYESVVKGRKRRHYKKYSFIATDKVRSMFDTEQKIVDMLKPEFGYEKPLETQIINRVIQLK